MNTKLLKQKILDLAIHGKLVPQNPDDEPASQLLRRISEEKEKLIAQGKIKRPKKSDAVNPAQECPFEIPDSWEWVRLGEIADIKSSKRVFEKDYVPKGIPFYRSKEIGDLYRGEEIHTELFISEEHYKLLKEKYGIPQKGDILITSVGSIGNCWICDGREFYYKDGNITQICANDWFLSEYIVSIINSNLFFKQVNSTVSGTAYNALTIIKLNKILIPLPPLAEQQRIVSAIEKWFSLIDEIETNKESLQASIKQTKSKVLDLAIKGKLVSQDINDEPASELIKRINKEKENLIAQGKIKRSKKSDEVNAIQEFPFEIPDSWEWVNLNQICVIKGGKRIPQGMSFANEPTSHIYIRVTDMKNNTILSNDLKYIDDNVFEKIKNYLISYSDLYLTIAGTIGAVGEVPKMFDGMNLTENAAKLTNIQCNKKYLMFVLMSTIAQEHFKSKFHQVAQPKLSIETAQTTLIPLPPLAEQTRIVSKIEEVFALLDEIERELA